MPAAFSQEVFAPVCCGTRVEPAILDVVTKRRGYEFETMSDEMVAEQQEIADTFFQLKLIPKPVKVEEIVWKPS